MTKTDAEFLLFLVLIIFFLFIGAAVGITLDKSNWENRKEHQQTTDNTYRPANHNAGNRTTMNPADQQDDGTNDQQDTRKTTLDERQLRTSVVLNILTAVIAVTSVAAAVVGLYALYILYGTLDATRVQARTAQQTLEATFRPWVGIDDASFSDISLGKVPKLHFAIKNYGASPALLVRMKFRFFVDFPADKMAKLSTLPAVIRTTEQFPTSFAGTIFSNKTEWTNGCALTDANQVAQKLAPSNRAELAAEKRFVCIFGTIIYSFPVYRFPYVATFCRYWNPQTGASHACEEIGFLSGAE